MPVENAHTSAHTTATEAHIVTPIFVSAGCNRITGTLCWWKSVLQLGSHLVLYGCHHLVIVYNVESCRVIATLRGHQAAVTNVAVLEEEYLSHESNPTSEQPSLSSSSTSLRLRIVSADAAGCMKMWELILPSSTLSSSSSSVTSSIEKLSYCSYELKSQWNAHTGCITSIRVIHTSTNPLIVSTGDDRLIRIWNETTHVSTIQSWECVCVSRIRPPTLIVTLAAIQTPKPDIYLIAAGGSDYKVHIYFLNTSFLSLSNSTRTNEGTNTLELVNAAALDGHRDWIRSITLCIQNKGDSSDAPSSTTDTNTDIHDGVEGTNSLTECLQRAEESKTVVWLATASQDKTVRVWKLTYFQLEEDKGTLDPHVTESIASAAATSRTFGSRGHLIIHRTADEYSSVNVLATLDSILYGHEDWVTCVQWNAETVCLISELSLLSSSNDRSVIVWQPQENAESLWTISARCGSVGGNTLGLFGAAFGPQGNSILAHGYSGSLHFWTSRRDENGEVRWTPGVVVGGHFNSVSDCAWDSTYNYLLTTSLDQTTRAWAPWIKSNEGSDGSKHPQLWSWHEIARPQVHGYDLHCIAHVGGVSHRFASGAEEKIVRVFLAPKSFLLTLHEITRLPTDSTDATSVERAVKAILPELGLSNRALLAGDTATELRGWHATNEKIDDSAIRAAILAAAGEDEEFGSMEEPQESNLASTNSNGIFTQPPNEEELISLSLWPEVEKLYGHGFEIISVAASHSGHLVASACQARKSAHAVVRLYDTTNWTPVAELSAHSTSVVAISFSHNDKYLLTASRDRHFTVFKFDSTTDAKAPVKSIARVQAHARIIWSVDWTPDDRFFATGSRDKIIKIWSLDSTTNTVQLHHTLPTFTSSVTSLAFAPLPSSCNGEHQHYLLAVGCDDGRLSFWHSTVTNGEIGINQAKSWKCVHQVDDRLCHAITIKRCTWQKKFSTSDSTLRLATCGDDHTVRIFDIDTEKLLSR